MKNQMRDKRSPAGKPLEAFFNDTNAMEPAEVERRTRKPARSTVNSAGTKAQRDAATRARKTAKPATERAEKAISRSKTRHLPVM